jgi:hypothetical protein
MVDVSIDLPLLNHTWQKEWGTTFYLLMIHVCVLEKARFAGE